MSEIKNEPLADHTLSTKQALASTVVAAIQLDRSIRRWRWLLISCLVIWGVSWMGQSSSEKSAMVGYPHVAVVDVRDGLKSSQESWYQSLLKVHADSQAKALVLRINSPGGVVHVADAGLSVLRRIKERMPVVTVVEQQAASAAYLLASQSHMIFAKETSIVGSIGVLSSVVVIKPLLEKLGIEYLPSKQIQTITDIPFLGLTPFIKQYLYQAGEDSYHWFQEAVLKGRGFNQTQLAKVVDGKIFLGKQAQSLGLVDALGGEQQAYEWLSRQQRGRMQDLPWFYHNQVSE